MLQPDLVLPALIHTIAAEEPTAPLLEPIGGAIRDYRTVDDAARRWAAFLRELGVDPDSTVATLLPAQPAAYEAWLGIAWLRAIEVPVNSMFRGSMLAYILRHSEAAIAVVGEDLLPQVLEIAADVPNLGTVVVVRSGDAGVADERIADVPWRVLEAASGLDAVEPLRADDPPSGYDMACMLYTSGTTGPSKGVLMPWRELYEFAAAAPPEHVDRDGGYYSAMPIFHASGKSSLYLAALARSRVVFRETFSVSQFWDDIRTHHCTSAGMVGVMGTMLLSMPAQPDDADNPLQRVMIGPLMAEIDEFCERFGVRVTTGYGMTEIGAALSSFGYHIEDWRSCGRPRQGYDLRIVDEVDEPVSLGDVGELVVRSDEPWMMNAGYWRMPEETAAAWRNGWFHTGDAFRQDDAGRFYFVDRMKDAFRRRGENISSFEVERLVLEHPAVADVAAVAVPSPLGEDDVMVHVVVAPGAELSPAALHAHLAGTMPRFMVPRYIEFTDTLPRTQTFRVRKVELRSRGLSHTTYDAEAAAGQPVGGA